MLTVAYSWLLPPVKTGVTNAILGNWQLSGISSWVSGAPLQVVNGTSPSFSIGGTNKDGVAISNVEHQRLARHRGDAGPHV